MSLILPRQYFPHLRKSLPGDGERLISWREVTKMSSAKDIGAMRAGLSALIRDHPELEEFVEDANEELWAIELALEMEEVDEDDS